MYVDHDDQSAISAEYELHYSLQHEKMVDIVRLCIELWIDGYFFIQLRFMELSSQISVSRLSSLLRNFLVPVSAYVSRNRDYYELLKRNTVCLRVTSSCVTRIRITSHSCFIYEPFNAKLLQVNLLHIWLNSTSRKRKLRFAFLRARSCK